VLCLSSAEDQEENLGIEISKPRYGIWSVAF
jgi:hypothetical protein